MRLAREGLLPGYRAEVDRIAEGFPVRVVDVRVAVPPRVAIAIEEAEAPARRACPSAIRRSCFASPTAPAGTKSRAWPISTCSTTPAPTPEPSSCASLAIRGENLASLAARFEIDLAAGPLGATGLFAITGETGAGKSTILDALCLALYGR